MQSNSSGPAMAMTVLGRMTSFFEVGDDICDDHDKRDASGSRWKICLGRQCVYHPYFHLRPRQVHFKKLKEP